MRLLFAFHASNIKEGTSKDRKRNLIFCIYFFKPWKRTKIALLTNLTVLTVTKMWDNSTFQIIVKNPKAD